MQSIILLLVFLSIFLTATAFFNNVGSRPMTSRNRLMMRERKCDITGKRKNSKAMSVSKSNRHTHREQGVNLQTKRLFWTEGNTYVRLRLSTKTLRIIAKNGLQATAKKYGVDLKKFSLSTGSAPVLEKLVNA